MESGNVVKVKDFVFLDGNFDVEGFQRRCIVLFENDNQVCVCPVVAQLNSFNANPDKYHLLPFSNRSGKQLTFAKLDSIVYINKEDILELIGHLDCNYMLKIITKIKNNYQNYENLEYYEDTMNKIEENIPVK